MSERHPGVVPEWDAGGGFAALIDEATDAQLLAFLDLLRDEINDRVAYYQEHGAHSAAHALWDRVQTRLVRTVDW